MAKAEQESEKKSWTTRFTKEILGVGALIAAAVAVIAQVEDFKEALARLSGSSTVPVVAPPPPPTAPPSTAPPPPSRKACFSLDFRHPETLPLNFFHRIPHPDHFPYWFMIDAQNDCNEDLTIEVEFKRFKGPFAIETDSRMFSDTLPPGPYESRIDPAITISNYNSGKPMVIKWSVRDDQGTVLHSGNSELELLPRSTIAWDLENADHKAVPRDYLLASLAAWPATPDPKLEEVAETCRPAAATDSESVSQLRDCYRRLFAGERPVFFNENPLQFPGTGRQTVRSPHDVLENGHGSQLEAAILLAAVGRQLGPRFRLIGRLRPLEEGQARVSEGGGDLKSFLLAMQTTPAADWQAVDFGRPAGFELEENLLAATAELDRLERNQPQIFTGLETTGVYLDADFVAIDFRQADHHFGIGRLPS